jgi:hypothetical protein
MSSLIRFSSKVRLLKELRIIDQMNLFEVYNGLVKANSLNKELGLDEAIKSLETRYGSQLRKNPQFLEIEATHNLNVLKKIIPEQTQGSLGA